MSFASLILILAYMWVLITHKSKCSGFSYSAESNSAESKHFKMWVLEGEMCLGFLGLECTSNISDWHLNYRCLIFYGDSLACFPGVDLSLHRSLAITFAPLCLAEECIEVQGQLAEKILYKAWSALHVHCHPLILQLLPSFCNSWLLLASLGCFLMWSIRTPLVDFGP